VVDQAADDLIDPNLVRSILNWREQANALIEIDCGSGGEWIRGESLTMRSF
jgi:hypothetical protein